MDELGSRLRRIAAEQHGVISVHQARTEGADRDWLWRHTRPGATWERSGHGALRLLGVPVGPMTEVACQLFDTGIGGVLSHDSAAALWGLPGFPLLPAHVSVPRPGPQRDERLAVAHRVRALPEADVTVLQALPVVRPPLVVLQLCGTVHPGRAERALDNAWARRLVSHRSLTEVLARLGRRGRPGVSLLRQLLEDRGPRHVPPDTGLEARFERLAREAGLAKLRRQVQLGDTDEWIGRVDYRADDRPLVVEVNSSLYHGALTDQRADAERYRRLEAAGFVVLAVWDVDVWGDPPKVMRDLRGASEQARLRTLARPA